jgi:hypothetical protein
MRGRPDRDRIVTTSRAPSICTLGSALPHAPQKLRAWRLRGRRQEVTRSRPASHAIVALAENRFAACAEPLSLRHREQ